MFIKKYLTLVALSAIALSVHAEESKELKFLGRTIVHEDGSWVNPNEPKFKLVQEELRATLYARFSRDYGLNH